MGRTSTTTAASFANYYTYYPSTIIFSARENKKYLSWQRETLALGSGKSKLGKLPTATQYDAFQRWRGAQKSLSATDFRFGGVWDLTNDLGDHLRNTRSTSPDTLSDDSAETAAHQHQYHIAAVCKHPLHPGATTSASNPESSDTGLCPCCVIKAHTRYLRVLEQVVERTSPECGEENPEHDEALKAWHYAKLHLLQTVHRFDQAAQDEEEWQAAHPDTRMDSAMSASKAARDYWAGVEAQGSEAGDSKTTNSASSQSSSKTTNSASSQSSSGTHTSTSTAASSFTSLITETQKQQARQVCFVQDPSLNLEPSRPQEYYRRTSIRYTPGKYAETAAESSTGDDKATDKPTPIILGWYPTDLVEAVIDNPNDREADLDDSIVVEDYNETVDLTFQNLFGFLASHEYRQSAELAMPLLDLWLDYDQTDVKPSVEPIDSNDNNVPPSTDSVSRSAPHIAAANGTPLPATDDAPSSDIDDYEETMELAFQNLFGFAMTEDHLQLAGLAIPLFYLGSSDFSIGTAGYGSTVELTYEHLFSFSSSRDSLHPPHLAMKLAMPLLQLGLRYEVPETTCPLNAIESNESIKNSTSDPNLHSMIFGDEDGSLLSQAASLPTIESVLAPVLPQNSDADCEGSDAENGGLDNNLECEDTESGDESDDDSDADEASDDDESDDESNEEFDEDSDDDEGSADGSEWEDAEENDGGGDNDLDIVFGY